jgi:RNA polymerase sigma-70 factor (ECF subfamily)
LGLVGGNTRESGIFAHNLIAQLPALRRYATGLAGRASEADDLVQDCIERALRQPDSLREAHRMGAWLRSIVFNLYVDETRRWRNRKMVDVADMQDDLAMSAPPEDRAGIHDFSKAMHSLSAEHRQILLLVGVEGLSYREIADELGVPVGTVMSRLARARERLRATLEGTDTNVVKLRRTDAS